MISELTGYTLTRTLPDSVLAGVLSGSYKVFGGVVRNDAGHIVAHLVNSGSSIGSLSTLLSPVSAAFSGLNTYQLYRIGSDVKNLVGLAHASMAVSGLTLAVSAAGFLFLNHKINALDKKLYKIAVELKEIRKFLELQERARLISALKVIRELGQIDDQSTKNQMLINSRQTLGEINEKYKALMIEDQGIKSFAPVEEYFTITAIGHALCSAELGMLDQALDDLKESQVTWQGKAREFVRESVLGKEPQRLLAKKYVPHVKAEEIAAWMDFSEGHEVGFGRLDDIRQRTSRVDINLFDSISSEEKFGLELTRKIVQRDRVLQGYVDQYKYIARVRARPSDLQAYFDTLPEQELVGGCHVFLSNEVVAA